MRKRNKKQSSNNMQPETQKGDANQLQSPESQDEPPKAEDNSPGVGAQPTPNVQAQELTNSADTNSPSGIPPAGWFQLVILDPLLFLGLAFIAIETFFNVLGNLIRWGIVYIFIYILIELIIARANLDGKFISQEISFLLHNTLHLLAVATFFAGFVAQCFVGTFGGSSNTAKVFSLRKMAEQVFNERVRFLGTIYNSIFRKDGK